MLETDYLSHEGCYNFCKGIAKSPKLLVLYQFVQTFDDWQNLSFIRRLVDILKFSIKPMKIGLVRHFKVKQKLPKGFLINYDTLTEWFKDYDNADIAYHDVDMRGINWEMCYASTMGRAHKTAQHIYKNEIQLLDDLREVSVLSLMNTQRRLPIILWAILINRKTFSANSITAEVEKKLATFIDKLLLQKEQEILIVSHGFIMLLLQKELKARGFAGDNFRNPANGKMYIFEKQ